jgi:hypothetical protein
MNIKAKDLRNTPIEALAKKVLGKDLLSDQELENFFDLESKIAIGQMTVSATETRQVRQYETNSYFFSIQFDLSNLRTYMEEIAARQYKTDEEAVQAFLDAKQTIIKTLNAKYVATENMIRDMIKEQQKGDGIKV